MEISEILKKNVYYVKSERTLRLQTHTSESHCEWSPRIAIQISFQKNLVVTIVKLYCIETTVKPLRSFIIRRSPGGGLLDATVWRQFYAERKACPGTRRMCPRVAIAQRPFFWMRQLTGM